MTDVAERAAVLEELLDEARKRYVAVFKPLRRRFLEAMSQCHEIVKVDADSPEADASRDRVRDAMRDCSGDPEIVEAGATLARLEDERRRLLLGASTSPDHQRGPTC
jgi:hypothetical protein